MLKYLWILAKRPSDRFILVSRAMFGVVIWAVLYYNLIYLNKAIELQYFGYDLTSYELYIKYGITALMSIPPFLLWITGYPLLMKNKMRMLQAFCGFLLIYVGTFVVVDTPGMDFDFVLNLFGFFAILVWISGKMITKKGLRFGEKVTKVRV